VKERPEPEEQALVPARWKRQGQQQQGQEPRVLSWSHLREPLEQVRIERARIGPAAVQAPVQQVQRSALEQQLARAPASEGSLALQRASGSSAFAPPVPSHWQAHSPRRRAERRITWLRRQPRVHVSASAEQKPLNDNGEMTKGRSPLAPKCRENRAVHLRLASH